MNGKYTVISLFAGGGGSSLGYKLAGFKELLAIEFNKNAIETLKENFNFDVWEKDITEIKNGEILKRCNIKKGELDILDGSPPCQGFSTTGKRNINDLRNDLYKSYIKILIDLNPKVFVMENVSGMIKGKMKGRFNEIFKELKSLNYNVKCKLMNAKYYNVPQARERLIFIGIRKDLNIIPIFPIPNKNIITVKEAIKNIKPRTLDNHSDSAKKIFNKIKTGKSGFNGIYFNYVKCHPNKPGPTMLKSICYNGAGYYHWNDNRSMSIEEMKAICSYPQEFKLHGKFSEQWARLGNSVMPNMMKAIAKNIKINILDKYYNDSKNILNN